MRQTKPKTLTPEERQEAILRYRAVEQTGTMHQASRAHYDALLGLLAKKHKIPRKHLVLNLQTGEISRNGKK
jgi:hypothetical protein